MVPSLDACVHVYMVTIMITNKEKGLVLEDRKGEFPLGHTVKCSWGIPVNISNELLHKWV